MAQHEKTHCSQILYLLGQCESQKMCCFFLAVCFCWHPTMHYRNLPNNSSIRKTNIINRINFAFKLNSELSEYRWRLVLSNTERKPIQITRSAIGATTTTILKLYLDRKYPSEWTIRMWKSIVRLLSQLLVSQYIRISPHTNTRQAYAFRLHAYAKYGQIWWFCNCSELKWHWGIQIEPVILEF